MQLKHRNINWTPSITCEKSALCLTLPKITDFLQGTPVSYRSNTGSIRDDPYWTSRKNSLELIKLSSINKVSLGFLL
jgi:hypothetical protein